MNQIQNKPNTLPDQQTNPILEKRTPITQKILQQCRYQLSIIEQIWALRAQKQKQKQKQKQRDSSSISLSSSQLSSLSAQNVQRSRAQNPNIKNDRKSNSSTMTAIFDEIQRQNKITIKEQERQLMRRKYNMLLIGDKISSSNNPNFNKTNENRQNSIPPGFLYPKHKICTQILQKIPQGITQQPFLDLLFDSMSETWQIDQQKIQYILQMQKQTQLKYIKKIIFDDLKAIEIRRKQQETMRQQAYFSIMSVDVDVSVDADLKSDGQEGIIIRQSSSSDYNIDRDFDDDHHHRDQDYEDHFRHRHRYEEYQGMDPQMMMMMDGRYRRQKNRNRDIQANKLMKRDILIRYQNLIQTYMAESDDSNKTKSRNIQKLYKEMDDLCKEMMKNGSYPFLPNNSTTKSSSFHQPENHEQQNQKPKEIRFYAQIIDEFDLIQKGYPGQSSQLRKYRMIKEIINWKINVANQKHLVCDSSPQVISDKYKYLSQLSQQMERKQKQKQKDKQKYKSRHIVSQIVQDKKNGQLNQAMNRAMGGASKSAIDYY